MIGRTHGVHAEPMTFGLKLALWYAEVARDVERVRRARATISVGKLSGAVGTFAHLPPAIEADVCRRLGLDAGAGRVAGDPARSPRRSCCRRWRSPPRRSRSSRSRSAACRRPKSARSRSRSRKGQKGSSAMPHKRNPIGCEQIVGLARLLRGNCHAALENIALWHERDISHSSVERVILPDSFIALDHMLRRFTRIVARHGRASGSDAREPRAARAASCFPGTVLLELAQKRRLARAGLRVGAAQRDAVVRRAARLQGAAARPIRTSRACCRRPRSSARSTSTSSSKHVDHIFDRVFQLR